MTGSIVASTIGVSRQGPTKHRRREDSECEAYNNWSKRLSALDGGAGNCLRCGAYTVIPRKKMCSVRGKLAGRMVQGMEPHGLRKNENDQRTFTIARYSMMGVNSFGAKFEIFLLRKEREEVNTHETDSFGAEGLFSLTCMANASESSASLKILRKHHERSRTTSLKNQQSKSREAKEDSHPKFSTKLRHTSRRFDTRRVLLVGEHVAWWRKWKDAAPTSPPKAASLPSLTHPTELRMSSRKDRPQLRLTEKMSVVETSIVNFDSTLTLHLHLNLGADDD
ncbi:hypothetical protein R3P38DRAFT_2799642 [Favolaschia claudopus]|uniref:Uncharacterized protein n=1 Tax=Favolaschia claudopus TaxID=2862362 RepID=A0AAV9ZZR7_9AGAR